MEGLVGLTALSGGGVLIASSLTAGFDVTFVGVAALLVFATTIGIVRLNRGGWRRVGWIGAIVATLGLLTTLFGWFLAELGVSAGVSIFAVGFFFGLHGGVLVVGVEATRMGSLPRWSPLPLVVGGLFVLIGLALDAGFALGGAVVATLMLVGGLGWGAIGFGFWSGTDTEDEADRDEVLEDEPLEEDRPADDAPMDDVPAERPHVETDRTDGGGFDGGRTDLIRVDGRVTLPDGEPVEGVFVTLYDTDPEGLAVLGEASVHEDGRYELGYTEGDIQRLGKARADLLVRAYNEVGTVVAESEPVFDVDEHQTIDLEVDAPEALTPSEYKRLHFELEPLLDDRSFRELTDDDVEFVREELDVEDREAEFPAGSDHIELLSAAETLAVETPVLAPIFYALGRSDYELDPETLASEDPESLREALVEAIDDDVIPADFRAVLDDELERIRTFDGHRRAREQETEDGEQPEVGEVRRAVVEGEDGEEPVAVEVKDAEEAAEEEAEALEEEPAEVEAEPLGLLAGPDTGEKLAERGYTATSDVVSESPATFARAVNDELDPEEASRMHTITRVRATATDSVALSGLTAEATRRAILGTADDSDEPRHLTISPRAYLDALVTYTGTYVARADADRSGGSPKLDAETLSGLFYQPFEELTNPTEFADDPVLYVRLCVESMLAYLDDESVEIPLDDGTGEFATAMDRYRSAAYDELLRQWGTSRRELRRAAHDDDEERRRIARRIGIEPDRVTGDDPGEHLHLRANDDSDAPDGLTEETLQRIFGLPAFTEVVDGSRTVRHPLDEVEEPALRAWRIEHLRRQWREEAVATDAFADGERPVVDPDVIGPDDFRHPDPDRSDAFALWRNRRRWVDRQLESIAESASDLTRTFEAMSAPDAFEYAGATFDGPWRDGPSPDEFEGISDRLKEGDDAEELTDLIRTDLHLDVGAFERLVELAKKHDESTHADRGEASRADRDTPLSSEDRRELASILVSALKASLTEEWVNEEVTIVGESAQPGDLFDPRRFWISLREPDRGEWSSWLDDVHASDDRPFVDPLRRDRDDLPEETAGWRVHELYDARSERLDRRRSRLETTYRDAASDGDENPFDAVLSAVHRSLYSSGPFAESNWRAFLETVRDEVDAGNDEAAAVLETDLYVSRDDLDVLVELSSRSSPEFQGDPPSDSQVAEAIEVLLPAATRRASYEEWKAEEEAEGITEYWQALKARLPRWRAREEDRRRWQEALRTRSRPPVIDPDLLRSESFFVGEETPALERWHERRDRLEAVSDGISLERGLDGALTDVVGVSGSTLVDLTDRLDRGENVSSRLDQLSLSTEEATYLADVYETFDEGASLREGGKADVRAVLIGVWKRRAFATWRREERSDGIFLAPEWFAIPSDSPGRVDEDDPIRWRIDRSRHREWTHRLEARIDQEDAVDEQVADAIAETEEEVLPDFRDALVTVVDPIGGGSFDESVRWLGERLLVDLQSASCRETTRVDHAIDSIQTLLVELDIGRLDGGLADLDLELTDDAFEPRWEWLGTYARWKSAMGVYLYPQNVLLPTLRRQQSPAFERLANEITGSRSLSDDDVTASVERYSTYFEDVTRLEPLAACMVENPERAGKYRPSGRGRGGASERPEPIVRDHRRRRSRDDDPEQRDRERQRERVPVVRDHRTDGGEDSDGRDDRNVRRRDRRRGRDDESDGSDREGRRRTSTTARRGRSARDSDSGDQDRTARRRDSRRRRDNGSDRGEREPVVRDHRERSGSSDRRGRDRRRRGRDSDDSERRGRDRRRRGRDSDDDGDPGPVVRDHRDDRDGDEDGDDRDDGDRERGRESEDRRGRGDDRDEGDRDEGEGEREGRGREDRDRESRRRRERGGERRRRGERPSRRHSRGRTTRRSVDSDDFVGYAFARSAESGTFYYRAFDPGTEDPTEAAGFWKPLAALEEIDGRVRNLYGVASYRGSIYVFVRTERDDTAEFGYVEYDVDSGQWKPFETIELPGRLHPRTRVQIVQTDGTDSPPEFVINLRSEDADRDRRDEDRVVRDHRDDDERGDDRGGRVRDHRSDRGSGSGGGGRRRDHRDGGGSGNGSGTVVRDHRTDGGRDRGRSDDDGRDDDDGPISTFLGGLFGRHSDRARTRERGGDDRRGRTRRREGTVRDHRDGRDGRRGGSRDGRGRPRDGRGRPRGDDRDRPRSRDRSRTRIVVRVGTEYYGSFDEDGNPPAAGEITELVVPESVVPSGSGSRARVDVRHSTDGGRTTRSTVRRGGSAGDVIVPPGLPSLFGVFRHEDRLYFVGVTHVDGTYHECYEYDPADDEFTGSTRFESDVPRHEYGRIRDTTFAFKRAGSNELLVRNGRGGLSKIAIDGNGRFSVERHAHAVSGLFGRGNEVLVHGNNTISNYPADGRAGALGNVFLKRSGRNGEVQSVRVGTGRGRGDPRRRDHRRRDRESRRRDDRRGRDDDSDGDGRDDDRDGGGRDDGRERTRVPARWGGQSDGREEARRRGDDDDDGSESEPIRRDHRNRGEGGGGRGGRGTGRGGGGRGTGGGGSDPSRRDRRHRTDGGGATLSTQYATTLAPVVPDDGVEGPWRYGVTSTDAGQSRSNQEDVRSVSGAFLEANQSPDRRTNVPYVAEAFYFVPLFVARKLTKSGDFETALEWFQTVYDYTRGSADEAPVWHGLVQEREGTRLQRTASGIEWLKDPLIPHSLAQSRRYPYTQFTIFSVVQCLLELADEEFTRDTSESVSRARILYELVVDLLDEIVEEMASAPDRPVTRERVPARRGRSAESSSSDEPALAAESDSGAGSESAADRGPSLLEAVERGSMSMADVREAFSRDSAVREVVQEIDGIGDERGGDGESRARLAVGGRTRRRGTDITRRYRPEAWAGLEALGITAGFRVPANPLIDAIRLHATNNLEKIRSCRNIAGLERQLEPRAASTSVEGVLPTLTGDGQLSAPEMGLQPTNFRYDTLIERAKELVNFAQQIEAEFFSALERMDQETYQLKRARQDVELARSGVRLQELRLDEARGGVILSELERERATIREEHFSGLLRAGLLNSERQALAAKSVAVGMHSAAANANFVAATLPSSVSVSVGLSGPSASVSHSPSGAMSSMASGFSSMAAAASTTASILSTQASHERREQDWRHQLHLAEQDARIGAQQIQLAQTRVDIVDQEREIAELETTHAEDIVTFHETKFTNRELFRWMSEILERVYRYFLQQATSMAKLAETQLAFERQERPPRIIKSGYWEASRADGFPRSDDESEGRRGLTGSARLLRDIVQLDQYKFETDEQKHRVEKTISLSQLDPIALQRFRETGVLRFSTPMELFDRDHPGHHLRMIKDVEASVIALTPPTEGVKATLTASGISRVVVGDHVFRKRVVRRQPESIVLRASQRRDHVTDFRPEDGEKLRPFENMGVESSWELRMPKPANQFDFDTIADVLVTIEYAALDSQTYRQQVTEELDSRRSAGRVFSFNTDFADQWYDLHNPDQTGEPMTVRFETDRTMFPPNLSDLVIDDVQLAFLGEDDRVDDLEVTLIYTERGETGRSGGVATPIDGVVRTPTASSWNTIRGSRTEGSWTLSLPDTAGVRELFDEDRLEDLVFVVTIAGELDDWPA